MRHAGAAALFAASLLCVFSGCRRVADAPASESPLSMTIRHEKIELIVSADPPQAHLDREIWLRIRVSSPTNVFVSIPPIEDRLKGLSQLRRFEHSPVTSQGRVTREISFWLAPQLSDEYRLGPMAILFRDAAVTPAREGWFPTRPFVLPLAPLLDAAVPGKIAPPVGPRWVRPAARTMVVYVLASVLLIGLTAILWRLGRRIRREVELRRLSPRERALREIEDLLARDLPGRARVKEFYLEITRIVRQYIERSHGVRAPEQTTEEFLGAILQNPRFDPLSVKRLKEFLTAADLVKFAAFIPDQPALAHTTSTAREYIVTDADRFEAAEKLKKGSQQGKG